jgi:hypothetical protein
MQQVAHHLQIHAHGLVGPERDAFARSAYNRYYYGCFLSLRATFTEMNPQWARNPHKSYPELLNGTISRRLKQERTSASKRGDADLVRIIDTALRAIPEISKIMTEANAARVVADYEPSIAVDFTDNARFSLNHINIGRAHEWHRKIEILSVNLQSAWKQINV